MRTLTTREKVLGVIVAVALVVTLAQQLVLEPQKRGLQLARKKLDAANQRITMLYSNLAALSTLRPQVERKERLLAALNQSLSHQTDLAGALRLLSEEVSRHGLRLQYMQPLETTGVTSRAGRPVKFLHSVIELGIAGSYKDLGQFFEALEKEPYYLRIVDLVVTPTEQGGFLLNVRLRVELVVQGESRMPA
jgi:Tfp pilus assembly protein PilO